MEIVPLFKLRVPTFRWWKPTLTEDLNWGGGHKSDPQ